MEYFVSGYFLKNTYFLALIAIFVICEVILAMPANPVAFDARQPDGKKIRLHIRGDERFHWFEDVEGYPVVRDKKRYAYGKLDRNGRLEATALTVGTDNPKAAGMKKKVLFPTEPLRTLGLSVMSGEEPTISPAKVQPTGTVKNLVVLCLFSDHTVENDARLEGDYDILFNQVGGDPTLAPTGSVKDYYLENSYDVMTLESTVMAWVTLPHSEAYYADGSDGMGDYPANSQGMVEDALDALNLVDPQVDFSQFDKDGDGYIDAITFIHSGYGAESGGGGGDWIWSHRWGLDSHEWTSTEGVKVNDYHTEPALWGTSGTNIVRFAVIAHELGHFFGLPDLYDTDGSGSGIGSWGIMANSWGFDNSQLHPPHFSAWSKIELGWVTPTVIDTPGTYTASQVETNRQIYRIDNGYPSGEYLLIENRQPTGIETKIPQGGLCIYHIDEQADDDTEGYPGQSGWPSNGNHYRVSLLGADGDYDLENGSNQGDAGDVYHGGGVSELSPMTVPNTDAYQSGNIIVTDNTIMNVSPAGVSMTFTYEDGIIPLPPEAFDMDVFTDINAPLTINLKSFDDSRPDPPSAVTCRIISLPNHGSLTDKHGVVINSVPHVLANYENEVIYTPRWNCRHAAAFGFVVNDGGTVPDGGDSNEATVTVNVVDLLYSANMDTDPGWTFNGHIGLPDWQWGVPGGMGGAHGNPDPTSGFTGANVIGYDISDESNGGDYAEIDSTEWAMTPAIDCSGVNNIQLRFYRWLNIEESDYDHAYIEISNDGSNWNLVWENSSEITDSTWMQQTYDISAFADDQATVYLRWGMGPTDRGWHYSGWNIDDVMVMAVNPVELDGDFDLDCDVDPDDLMILLDHWLETCPECDGTDLSDDGVVDLRDISILAQNWLSEV